MTHTDEGSFLPLPERIGPFRILSLLGSSSNGQVYEAVHLGSSETVALKVVLLDRTGPTSSHARADRETSALEKLHHPGVARLIASGTFDSDIGSFAYVATHYVEGPTLRQFCESPGRSIDERLQLLAELCDILETAHRSGIVHRDLKPENIIVGRDGHPVVLDFGLAKFLPSMPGTASRSITTGQLVGTIAYMSPEQASAASDRMGAATDIYALGVLGFEMLCGELPYRVPADNQPSAIVTIADREPRWLGDMQPVCRGTIESIFRRALEKEIPDRYASAAEMAQDLRRAVAGRLVSRSTPGRTRHQARCAWRSVRKKRRVLRRARLVSILLLGAAAAGVWSNARRSSPSPQLELDTYFDFVSAADVERHAVDPWETGRSGPIAAEACKDPIARFERALEMCKDVQGLPSLEAEVQYLEWRLAELFYFVGESLHDPAATGRACAQFEQANRHPWPLFDPVGPPPTNAVGARIRFFGPQGTLGGCALCEASLARYQSPALHLRRALDYRRMALRAFDAAVERYADFPLTAAERNGTARDLGLALVRAGAACDSVRWLDEGRHELEALARRATDPTTRATDAHHIGRAWRVRAELLESAADADSAARWLALALAGRTAGRDRWDTTFEMACASLVGAALERSTARTADAVHWVSAVAADSVAARNPRGDGFLDALTDLALADMHLRLADRLALVPTAATIGPLLDEVERLLERAALQLADRRYSAPRAELALHRSHCWRLRAAVPAAAVVSLSFESSGADLAAVLSPLEEALGAIPVAASPRLHRLIRAEIEALGSLSSTPTR